MSKEYKEKIAKLKQRIKELAAEGRACRETIRNTTKYERWCAWEEKRDIGRLARHHLIAYGLLRGRDYHKIEANVRPHNDWDYDFCQRVKAVTKICQEYCLEEERDKWTEDHIREILSYSRREESNRQAVQGSADAGGVGAYAA